MCSIYGGWVVKAQPFIKWAGGKRQLLKELTTGLPNFRNYHEPFLGGGALFFELFNKGLIKHAHLYDYNDELITAYKAVKDMPFELIKELQKPIYKNDENEYYRIRALKLQSMLERAARLIYLNHTAYNGLYRVNSNGEFNVPFGNYKNPKLFSEEVILADSKALQNAELHSGDFSMVLDYAEEGDLIYFDPPYNPLSVTSNFTSYTSADFSEEDQKRLAKVFGELDKRGCYVMLSNSSTELIRKLYKGYYIRVVYANRAINCKADGRGKVQELIITNWKISQKQLKLTESLLQIP